MQCFVVLKTSAWMVCFSPKTRTPSGRVSTATLSLLSVMGDELKQKLVIADDERGMVRPRVTFRWARLIGSCREAVCAVYFGQ